MFVVLSTSPSFTPIVLEQVEVPAGTPIPSGASGAWIILVGTGGTGGNGFSQNGSDHIAGGGGGGGGGSRVGWGFVPVSAMGSTYSLTFGTTTSRFTTFISGGVTLSAGWGGNGGTGFSGGGTGGSGAAGVASQAGISGIPLNNGGSGGTNTTNGGGAGGGAGGSGNSHGSGSHTLGSAGGIATGGASFDGFVLASQNGANGAAGTGTSSLAKGGVGGGGGGGGAGSGQIGGSVYIRLKWV